MSAADGQRPDRLPAVPEQADDSRDDHDGIRRRWGSGLLESDEGELAIRLDRHRERDEVSVLIEEVARRGDGDLGESVEIVLHLFGCRVPPVAHRPTLPLLTLGPPIPSLG